MIAGQHPPLFAGEDAVLSSAHAKPRHLPAREARTPPMVVATFRYPVKSPLRVLMLTPTGRHENVSICTVLPSCIRSYQQQRKRPSRRGQRRRVVVGFKVVRKNVRAIPFARAESLVANRYVLDVNGPDFRNHFYRLPPGIDTTRAHHAESQSSYWTSCTRRSLLHCGRCDPGRTWRRPSMPDFEPATLGTR